MYDVIALGELLIDFTCQSRDADGYPLMAAHPGGAPANYLAALAKYGKKTALLGKVGEDSFGRLLLSTLEKANIGTEGMVVSEDYFTTLAFVTLDEHGDREFSFARKPGADTQLSFDELKTALIDEARVFHFGTLSLTDEPARSATYKAVDYAKARGKLISFDPNLRPPLWRSLDEAREQMLWGLSMADVVKISDEEAEFLFGLEPQRAAQHILAEFGPQLVFVTCGADGCHFATKSLTGFEKSLEGIKVIDTTGAGDIFGGSAMSALLDTGKAVEQLSLSELSRITAFACTAAGLSTTRPGGISSVPELAEVRAALEKRC